MVLSYLAQNLKCVHFPSEVLVPDLMQDVAHLALELLHRDTVLVLIKVDNVSWSEYLANDAHVLWLYSFTAREFGLDKAAIASVSVFSTRFDVDVMVIVKKAVLYRPEAPHHFTASHL